MSRTSQNIPHNHPRRAIKKWLIFAYLCLHCVGCGHYQLRADHQNATISTPVHLPFIAIDAKHGLNAHQMTQDLAAKLRAQGLFALTVGQAEAPQTTVRCRVRALDVLDYGSTQRTQARLVCVVHNKQGPPVEFQSRGQNTIAHQTQRPGAWQVDRQTKQLALFDAHQQMARRLAAHLRQLASNG